MTISAVVLALAAAALAQSSDAPPAVYAHPKGRLTVFSVQGAYNPDAVYVASAEGQYLVRDAELYTLGHDVDEEQVRYEIYWLRPHGLEYKATSRDRGSIVNRWDEGHTVEVMESVIKRLNERPGKKKLPAPAECRERGDELSGLAARHDARRRTLQLAANWNPKDIKDPAKLAEQEGEVQSARGEIADGAQKCAAAKPEGYRAAHQAFDAAARRLEQVGHILDWMPR